MTRRDFIGTAATATIRSSPQARLLVPVHRIMDARAQCSPEQLRYFWSGIWPEAVRDFGRGGIQLQTSDGPGEVRRSPADRPIFIGLRRGVINLVLTDHLPLYWDSDRALAGVSALWDGYPICMIALRYAHGNQIPFLSVNTCVHEILHALLQGHLRKPPEVVSIRQARIPNRLVCNLPLAVSAMAPPFGNPPGPVSGRLRSAAAE